MSRGAADLEFANLNANAARAIPKLEALMRNNQKPDMSSRAIYALGAIGGGAIPALTIGFAVRPTPLSTTSRSTISLPGRLPTPRRK